MMRKWNRFLSFLLAVALIATTFHSDIASIRVFAEEDIEFDEPSNEESTPAEEQEEEQEDYQEPSETSYDQGEGGGSQGDEGLPGDTPEADDEDEKEPAEDEELPDEELPDEEIPEDEELLPEEPVEEEEEELVEEEEEELVEEKLVTVTYEAELGGRVTTDSETIDINDKEAKFEGSTARAVNKYYQFTGWYDEDGDMVTSDDTIVPSDIEEDTTYLAKFMKLSEMPAKDFSGSAGGMNVDVSADEGIFPAGTYMVVTAISRSEAMDAASNAMGTEVKNAVGVDISFYNEDGEEIEPANAKYVHVSLSLANALEGDEFKVVHKDDDGSADVIASASADGAEFETNSFSIYIIADMGEISGDDDEDEKAVCIYEFYNGDDLFNTQSVKAGEVLADPGIPNLVGNEEFLGWYIGEDKVVFGKEITEVTSGTTYKAYAKIKKTYYLTFKGLDGEVVQVRKATVTGDERPMIETAGVEVEPKGATEAFKGWTSTPGGTTPEASVDASLSSEVYPIIVGAYWITFDPNDGGNGGASYTAPAFVENGQPATDVEPADPERTGYTFDGWWTEQGTGDGQVAGQKFDFDTVLTGNITLYAKWTANPTTKYTVILWQQKIDNDKDLAPANKTYDYKGSYEKEGNTGSSFSEAAHVDPYKGYCDEGFHYARYEFVRMEGDTAVPVSTIRAKGDSIVNIYFDRDTIDITFVYTTDKKNWTDYKTFTGLYGQLFSKYNEVWPDQIEGNDYDWYESYKIESKKLAPDGKHTTFLGTFLETRTLYGFSGSSGNYTINHYKQGTDGKYNSGSPANQTKESGGTWYFTNKYNGFEVKQYYIGNSYPSKESSWKSAVDGGHVTYSNNLYIRYERKKFDLTFMDNFDGVQTEKDKIEGIYYEKSLSGYAGSAPTEDDMPKRLGYKFVGWYEDTNGSHPFDWNQGMPAANKVVYAKYSPVTFTITLDANGGTLPAGQDEQYQIAFHDKVDKDAIMQTTRDGYQLVGWYEGSTAYVYPEVEKNTTLIAKWRKIGTISVEYDASPYGSGAPTDNFKYAGDSAVVVGPRPTSVQEGYTFIGWTIVGDPKNEVYYPNNSFDIIPAFIDGQTVTLKAVYQKTGDPGTATEEAVITYDANGGAGGQKSFTYRKNTAFTAKTAEEVEFSRENYQFLGWAKSADATEAWIQGGDEISIDNVDIPNILYAVWKHNTGKYHIEYYKGTVTDSSDTDHYLGRTANVEATVGKEIYLTDAQIAAKKPGEGYKDGVQVERPYVVEEGDDNIIYVLYEPVEVVVTVEGTQIEKVYDGQTYTVSGFKVTSITPGTGYKAEYVTYDGIDDLTIAATHVDDSKEVALDLSKFGNNSSFDTASIKFQLGAVKSNKVEITPATLTITTLDASKEYDGTPLTAGGSISGFKGSDSASFVVTGTITDVGETDNTYSITWDHAQKNDYKLNETIGKLKITHNQSLIKVKTTGGTFTYNGDWHGATVSVTGVPAGYELGVHTSNAKAKDVTVTPVEAKADNLVITYKGVDVTKDLNIQYENGTIIVEPKEYSVETYSDSKAFDGTPLTAEGEITGIVEGETYTFKTTGTQTNPGSSDNTYSLTWNGTAKASNYKLASEVIGTLTVTETEAEVVVRTTAGTYTYDGKEKKATVTVEGLPDEYTYEAESYTKATNVTTSPIHAKADVLKIYNPSGKEVSGELTITRIEDDLIINPAPLTVVTYSAEKIYDGDPLTADGYVQGFVNGEDAPFTITGTQTDVGKSDNTYEIDWDSEDATAKLSNYELSESVGELTVEEYDGMITITTIGGKFPYDGTAHGATDITVDGLPKNYTFKASSSTTVTEVADGIKDVTADELIIYNNKGVDVTDVMKKKFEDGKIQIIPRPVTVKIKGDQQVKPYNGTWQTAEGYKEISISDSLYKTSFYKFEGEAIAKRMAVGTTYMELDEEQFVNENTNFEVTFSIEDGFIRIRDREGDELYSLTAITDPVNKVYTGEVFTDFDYRLVGEGPTESFVQEAFRSISGAFNRVFGGITAGAYDASTEHKFTVNGVEYKVTGLYVPRQARDAGDYTLDIEGTLVIKDPENNTVTDQFTFNKEIGTLHIDPMPIRVESATRSKVYDGTPLRDDTVTTDKNWGIGDEVYYVVTGEQTEVGSSANFFEIKGDGVDFDRNYYIDKVEGTLTVTSSGGGGGDDPTPGGTTITDDPTPTAATPVAPPAAVLGAVRPEDEPAVLGARRARTDDATNRTARILIVLVAAGIAAVLIAIRKKEN